MEIIKFLRQERARTIPGLRSVWAEAEKEYERRPNLGGLTWLARNGRFYSIVWCRPAGAWAWTGEHHRDCSPDRVFPTSRRRALELLWRHARPAMVRWIRTLGIAAPPAGVSAVRRVRYWARRTYRATGDCPSYIWSGCRWLTENYTAGGELIDITPMESYWLQGYDDIPWEMVELAREEV